MMLAENSGLRLIETLLAVRSQQIKEDIQRRQVIAKPGTCKTYKRFEVEIYVLTKDEGGRHTAFVTNYRPQFYMRTADATGKVQLLEEVNMVMPGDDVTAVFELISAVPLEAGHRFALREGGVTAQVIVIEGSVGCDPYSESPDLSQASFIPSLFAVMREDGAPTKQP